MEVRCGRPGLSAGAHVAPLLSSPFCVEAATTDNALATCVECVMLMDGLWKWMAWLLCGCWLGFSARAGRSVVVVGVGTV